MKKAARKHNPYRTFAEYEIQEREIPAYVLKAMRDLNMKSSNPTTTHNAVSPMPLVFVSDERHKPDSSSSVSMRQAQ
jgi:hypothetical protein